MKFHVVSLTALINTKLITINLTEAEQQSRHQLQLSTPSYQLPSCTSCTSWCGDVHQMNIYQAPKWRLPPRVPAPHSCVMAPQLVSRPNLTFLAPCISFLPYIPYTLHLTLRSLGRGLHITCNRLGLGRAVVQAVMARKKLHISLWAGASKCWQCLQVQHFQHKTQQSRPLLA